MSEFLVEINGVAKNIRSGSFVLREIANRHDTLFIDIISLDGSYKPSRDDEVIVTKISSGKKIFGGVINGVDIHGLADEGALQLVSKVTASSFAILAEHLTVSYTVTAGDTLLGVLQDLAALLATKGVTLSGTQATGGTFGATVPYVDVTTTSILNAIALLSGWIWNINPDKVLSMIAPGSVFAPYNVAPPYDAANGDVIKDVVLKYKRQTFYANKVVVKYGGSGTQTLAEFHPGDGVARRFLLDLTASFVWIVNTYDVTGAYIQGFPVGTYGVDTMPWTFDSATNEVVQDPSEPVVAGGAGQIRADYAGSGPKSVMVENVAAQAAPTGIRSVTVTKPEITTLAAATAFAQAELARRLADGPALVYLSKRYGEIEPGMVQDIDASPTRGIDSTFLAMQVVTTQDRENQIRCEVELAEVALVQGMWPDTYILWATFGGGGGGGSFAAPFVGAVGPSVFTLHPMNNERPLASYALWRKRNRRPALRFSGSADTVAAFSDIMSGIGATGIIVRLILASVQASSGSNVVRYEVAIERVKLTDIDADSFATAQAGTVALAGQGIPVTLDVAFTTSQIDGVVQGEACRIFVKRTATHASDTYTGEMDMLVGYVLAQ